MITVCYKKDRAYIFYNREFIIDVPKSRGYEVALELDRALNEGRK